MEHHIPSVRTALPPQHFFTCPALHPRPPHNSGDIRSAVALPPNEDFNEWLATNTVDFFNEVRVGNCTLAPVGATTGPIDTLLWCALRATVQINLLYGAIVEFCTKESCPVMKAAG